MRLRADASIGSYRLSQHVFPHYFTLPQTKVPCPISWAGDLFYSICAVMGRGGLLLTFGSLSGCFGNFAGLGAVLTHGSTQGLLDSRGDLDTLQ